MQEVVATGSVRNVERQRRRESEAPWTQRVMVANRASDGLLTERWYGATSGQCARVGCHDVGVDAKREHLLAFQKAVLDGRQMLLSGVSLGWAAASHLPAPAAHPVPDLAVCSPTRIPWPCSAAIIIDFYAAHPEAVAATVLVDPQGFLDGTPPVPERFARAGIQVLGSWPLRSMANQMAYYDTDTLATDDAIRVGQLHCLRPG